jgi:pimeloyl-ACP methyl ester carboxylesterase
LSSTFRYILLIVGIFLSLPLIILLLFVPTTPVSAVGIIYLLSYCLIVIGMIGAPWWSRRSVMILLTGVTMALATGAIRTMFPPSGTRMNLISLPRQSGPRLLNRIFDEQDVVLFGAQAAPYLGAISPSEKNSLDIKFSQTFREMRLQGVTPLSPFLTTYLDQQRPNEFDAILAEPASEASPKSGIIFLHGSGGNFTLQCWLIARAGYGIDAMTVCPSTSVSGAWWNTQGQSILEETFAYLRQRGVERIYLTGLSNGGIGASRLAHRYKNELKGLILISGADPDAEITELPVLLLHGKYDERISTSFPAQYASAAGHNATYHLFEGDHFLLLKQRDQVQAVIIDWLSQQELK